MLPRFKFKLNLSSFFKKTTISASLFLLVVFLLLIFNFNFVYAQDAVNQEMNTDIYGLQDIDETVNLVDTDIRIIIGRIIKTFLGLLGIVVVVLIIYAGFLWMTAGGEEEKIGKAKKILLNSVIGLAIILSSYSITNFILKKLTNAIRGGLNAQIKNINWQSFSGSGSLGSVIKDHYPFRNQKDVPRNTNIIISFIDEIKPESFVNDDNHNDIYGDCLEINNEKVCDTLKIDVIKIFVKHDNINFKNVAEQDLVQANVLVSNDKKTIVIKPVENLGTEANNVNYEVYLSNKIKNNNDEGVFSASVSGYYKWQFTTGTDLDITPPHVVSVFPSNQAQNIAKNAVIQINFSEPINPLTIQGELCNENRCQFKNIVFHKFISGQWRVSNSYKTVEFIPNSGCNGAINSCGQIIYCLPVDNQTEMFKVLLRTGEAGQEEGWPFYSDVVPSGQSGIMDLCNNVLDGNNDNKYEPVINVDQKHLIADEENFDNYWWSFEVVDRLEIDPPIIEKVTPSPGMSNVNKKAPIVILFNKPMLNSSFQNGFQISEFPNKDEVLVNFELPDNAEEFWYRYRSNYDNVNKKTTLIVDHRVFGYGTDLNFYYFSSANEKIKDLYQNCFYPGQGPNGEDNCQIDGVNCVQGQVNSQQDTVCASGNFLAEQKVDEVETCQDIFKQELRQLNQE